MGKREHEGPYTVTCSSMTIGLHGKLAIGDPVTIYSNENRKMGIYLGRYKNSRKTLIYFIKTKKTEIVFSCVYPIYEAKKTIESLDEFTKKYISFLVQYHKKEMKNDVPYLSRI
jgi:hypothetical protein